MNRVVKINVNNINIATGFLISLPNDEEKDVILTVCHVFGEIDGDSWNMWDIEPNDIEISSDYYYGLEFKVIEVLYKDGDADMNDFALIYVNKIEELINDENMIIPRSEDEFLNCKVIIEGYGMDETNDCSRVIYGFIHDFINYEKIMYRINYNETDKASGLKTVELNRGMSGSPVYINVGRKQYFVGMQKFVSSEKSTDGILGAFTYKYCIERIRVLYGIDLPLQYKVGNLIDNDSLFKNLYIFHRRFDILPSDKEHIGSSIAYEDINELRDEFIEELIGSMIDWVYCSEKYDSLLQQSINDGRSESAAAYHIRNKAIRKFRKDIVDNMSSAYRQIAELVLFHFIQRFIRAVPILRKENIYKNSNCEYISSDAIHYKYEEDANIIVLGQSIIFDNSYNFKQAFEKSLDLAVDKHRSLRRDLNLYTYENFLDKEMIKIAESYLNKTMENTKVNLVNIVIYNENQTLNITEEEDIRIQVESLIEQRYKDFNNDVIDSKNSPILKRITYIILPIWELEELVKIFQDII